MTKRTSLAPRRPRVRRRPFEQPAVRRRRERLHFTKDLIDMAANLLAAFFAK